MEQDKLPCADPGPGQCGSDREVFERVWRRVMPEDRPDCPFRLYGEEEQAGMERLLEQGAGGEPSAPGTAPAQSAPAVPTVLPPDGKRQTGGGNDVPLLGAASAVYGEQLQAFIVRELADMRTYQALARRAPSAAARALGAMAADERRHAKRLSTAYFLISGVRFWPEQRAAAAAQGALLGALRARFVEEQRGEAAYLAAADATADPCLRELYRDLAGDESAHAWQLRTILEGL